MFDVAMAETALVGVIVVIARFVNKLYVNVF